MKLPKGHILKSLTILQVSLSEQAQFVFPNLWDIWRNSRQNQLVLIQDQVSLGTQQIIVYPQAPSADPKPAAQTETAM